MKRTIRAFLLCAPLVAGALSLPSSSAVSQATGPAAAAALVSEFDVNGLKVLVKRRLGSQTVAASLYIRGGSLNITSENAGIEAMMLDLSSEASVAYPRERLRRELARTGSVIGSNSGYDYSELSLRSTRANFERSWDAFVDVALHPAFTPEDFALVKNRHLVSLRSETDDPDTWLERLSEKSAFALHPYANRQEGTAESVSGITLADIRRYHQRIMQSSRLLLVVVGDLDPAQLRSRIAAAFGSLPKGTYQPERVPSLSFSTPALAISQRALPTNYIQGSFVTPELTDPDVYAMRVATNLLNDRVFEEVRVKRNLSYSPSASLKLRGASVGQIYVTAVDANQAVTVMLNEIRKLQTDAVDPQDIIGVAAQYLTTYYMNQETNAAQADNLAEYELIGGGWRNSFQTIDGVKAVTPADVQAVALKYMKNIRFVVLGDPSKINQSIFTGM